MRLFKKTKYNSYLISSFIIVIIIISYSIFFITYHNYDEQGTNIKNFDSVSSFPLTEKQNIIEQTILSKNNNLDKIYFYIRNTNSNNNIELSLLDQNTNKVLQTQTKIIPKLDSIQLIYWDFDNIIDSKNKKLSLFIVPEKNKGFEIITTPKDRYDEGILFINTVDTEDSILAFSFDYYTSSIFKVLYKRLPIYKMGVFKYSITYIIVFTLILGSAFYTIYLINNDD